MTDRNPPVVTHTIKVRSQVTLVNGAVISLLKPLKVKGSVSPTLGFVVRWPYKALCKLPAWTPVSNLA